METKPLNITLEKQIIDQSKQLTNIMGDLVKDALSNPRFIEKMGSKVIPDKVPVQTRIPINNVKELRKKLLDKGWNISEYVAFHIECLIAEKTGGIDA